MKHKKGYYESARNRLAEFLLQIQKDDLEFVLDDLLTPQEISEFAERIQLLKQLKQGKTQRDIAEDMGISVTTVNRWSRILKYGTGSISHYL
jgi:Trp operon repressor